MVSNDQAEVLALDQEVLAASGALGGWVGGQHEGLAEPALRLLTILAVPHSSTDKDEDRHVLDSHLRLGLQPAAWQSSGICFVDNLTIIGLDFEVCRGHLVDEDVLYCRAIGDLVSVEDDGLRVGIVVGAYGFTVCPQSLVEGMDKFSGS